MIRRLTKFLVPALTILLINTSVLVGADYFVATDGNDGNAGTMASPWRTIQHAADSVSAGDSVYIRAGTYEERVTIQASGSASAGYITFSPYENESVIIDCQNLTAASGDSAVIWIENQNYLVIKGLEIANYTTSDGNNVVMGIMVTGSADHIQLLNNHVHNIEQNTSSAQGDAHAVAVYATNGSQPIQNLTITGNTINDCRLGSSEALVLNGNVDGFTVSKNTVHDCNNIGIDLIGWEGTAPDNDQARNGTVADNTVYDITSYGNPAYGNERSAAGIYVDGGRDIIVERNLVYRCDFGVEVASEHQGRTTSAVTVRDNILYNNLVAGITFGGYDTNRGTTLNCVFSHNTLYHNDTTGSGNGEIMIQKSHDNTISNNIVVCDSQNILISNYFNSSNSYANTFNYNLYYCAAGSGDAIVVWQEQEYNGFDSYQSGSGEDANSLFADPMFQDSGSAPPNFHLLSSSPAIDAGDPNFTVTDQDTDFDGQSRIVNNRTDCGAYEYQNGQTSTYQLTVNSGTGSGYYQQGEQVVIRAAAPGAGQTFAGWTGDTVYLLDPSASETTVTMPAAPVTVTATYDGGNALYLSVGSILVINATDVDANLAEFLRKPNVSAEWGTGDSSLRLSVITKVSRKQPQTAVEALWKKAVPLFDKGDYKGELISDMLKQTPITDLELDDILVSYRDPKNDVDISDQALAITAYLAVPVITGIQGEHDSEGDVFTIEGRYFGAKAPIVWVEYYKKGDTTRPAYKKCKVDKKRSLVYEDGKGKAGRSCMKIREDDGTDEQAVGYSSIIVTYPKLHPDDQPTGYLILNNKIGMTLYPQN